MTSPADFSYVVNCALLDLLFEPVPARRSGPRRHAIYRAAKMMPADGFPAAFTAIADHVDRVFALADPSATLLCRDDGAGRFGYVTRFDVELAVVMLATARRDDQDAFRAYAVAVMNDAPMELRADLLSRVIRRPVCREGGCADA